MLYSIDYSQVHSNLIEILY